jgi:hypothetical protein
MSDIEDLFSKRKELPDKKHWEQLASNVRNSFAILGGMRPTDFEHQEERARAFMESYAQLCRAEAVLTRLLSRGIPETGESIPNKMWVQELLAVCRAGNGYATSLITYKPDKEHRSFADVLEQVSHLDENVAVDVDQTLGMTERTVHYVRRYLAERPKGPTVNVLRILEDVRKRVVWLSHVIGPGLNHVAVKPGIPKDAQVRLAKLFAEVHTIIKKSKPKNANDNF